MTEMARDNAALRVLFRLPPIAASTSTALAVPELPPREVVTGDAEIDAVLWLRKVISTGQKALIDKAMEAAKLITTPLPEVGKRYGQWLMRQGGPFAAALGSFDFDNLDGLARRSLEKAATEHEAISRFGSVAELFKETPAEKACKKALRGAKKKGAESWSQYSDEVADARFLAFPELEPCTLSDCLHVQDYWDALYDLRQASLNNAGDHWPQVQAHDDFAFRSMARIAPSHTAEALQVLERLVHDEAMGRAETNDILRNLIAGRSPA